MLSRTINVDWEFVSDRFLRLHLNDVHCNTTQAFASCSCVNNCSEWKVIFKTALQTIFKWILTLSALENPPTPPYEQVVVIKNHWVTQHDEVEFKFITSCNYDKSDKIRLLLFQRIIRTCFWWCTKWCVTSPFVPREYEYRPADDHTVQHSSWKLNWLCW